MTKRLKALLEGLKARPLPAAVVLVLGTTALGVAGFYSYRTYDFIEHDNDFCMSCHLMEEPFEEFARSAHRDLGCKACHQPSLLVRSQMGLTQIVEQPTELETHAEVPNERCAACHVDGDPDRWETIRNSAGHLVHLESDATELSGLLCVECHSSSVHEFTATDQTCGQTGCHDDTNVQLGRMGGFTIHCTACHGFSSPVAVLEIGGGQEAAAAGQEAFRPGEDTCLSCHAMRGLVDLPDDDPHEADCAACHNPHEQTEPAQAVETCSSAGCHSERDALSGFHHGLEPETAAGCMACHNAHDFYLDGSDCRGCHVDGGLQGVGRLGFGFHDAEPLWLLRHGQAARQSLEACASCHAQNECVQCHSVTGAFQINPHAPGFDAGSARDRNPAVCLVCHIAIPGGRE